MAGRNLGASLDELLGKARDITPQQRAVAQDLSYGTLRFYGQVQGLLSQLLEKPLSDERVRCLLLVALYQLQHDKAASHTVVDQAVQAASQLKKPWAKGLVNAVLRNFLRKRETLLDKLDHSDVATYSYPQWWINKLKQQYPRRWQAMLQAGNAHPPMTLRVNTRQVSAGDYAQQLGAEHIEFTAMADAAVMLSKATPVDRVPGFFAGQVSVQDYGAQFAADFLEMADGMRVLDACCAPGGKTGHLLETADIQLVAMDSDAQRLQRTRDNLQRLKLHDFAPQNKAPEGDAHVSLVVGDAASHDWWDGRPFDRILADVPCTASGIVRRHVDIKWLRREADIASFTRQQAAILPSLWRLLAKGGKLLYVTCSVFHEENQQQIDHFLGTHADALQLPLSTTKSATWGTADTHHAIQPTATGNAAHGRDSAVHAAQLLPCAEHDGFFYALLQKI